MKRLARAGLVMAFLLTGFVVSAVAFYPTAAMAQDDDSGDEGGGDEGGGDEGGGED